jgi:hypothetical protein
MIGILFVVSAMNLAWTAAEKTHSWGGALASVV